MEIIFTLIDFTMQELKELNCRSKSETFDLPTSCARFNPLDTKLRQLEFDINLVFKATK